MAAPKVSSSMPRVSDILLCTAAGKNMTKKIYTAPNGRFTIKIGMKQTSRAYGYQVQYRHSSRYTKANEAKKSAKWTANSSWKNDRAFTSGGITYAVGSTYDANNWGKCNIGVNKTSTYHAFDQFTNSYVGDGYDCRSYQYRVRTYNPKTNTAGAWVYSDWLYFYKAAIVENFTLHRSIDGGLLLEYNYQFDRGIKLVLQSVTDSEGRDILEKQLSLAANYDSGRTASTVPAKRAGYTPGVSSVQPSQLKRAPEYGEQMIIAGYVQTTDGAKTDIGGTYAVQNTDYDIDPPSVTVSDLGFGFCRVVVRPTSTADVVTDVGCVCKYVYNGKTYSVSPDVKSVADSGSGKVGTYTFYNVPVDIDLKFTGTLKNGYDTISKTTTYRNGKAAFYLHMVGKPTSYRASLEYNANYSLKSNMPYTLEMPHGRKLPWVAYGIGTETALTLSGDILAADQAPTDMLSTSSYAAWESVRNNQGVYLLRCPEGRMHKVAIQDVSISAEGAKVRSVSVTAAEVS